MEEDNIKLQYILKERRIYYNTTSYVIPSAVHRDFFEDLGPSWSNPEDEMIAFSYYESGHYVMEKKRIFYDWKLKMSKTMVYEVSEISEADLEMLVKKFTELYDFCRITHLQNTKDELKLQMENEFGMISYNLLDLRRRLLSSTDWTQVLDSPLEEKVKLRYQKYRQELRDITSLPEWNAEEYLKVEFPISPTDYLKKYPNEEVEYLSTEDQYIAEVVVRLKAKLLKFAGYLGLSGEALGFDVDYFNDNDNMSLEDIRARVDHILRKIDPTLEITIKSSSSSCDECEV